MKRRLLVLVVALLVAGCSTGREFGCTTESGAPMQVFSLYFGRTIHGGGFVSDADWRGFRDDVLTAALPGGYTVLDAEGAWAAPDGRRTLAEPTKMLIVALPAVPSSWAAIAQVRQAYRTRFAQEAVGMTVQPGCASF